MGLPSRPCTGSLLLLTGIKSTTRGYNGRIDGHDFWLHSRQGNSYFIMQFYPNNSFKNRAGADGRDSNVSTTGLYALLCHLLRGCYRFYLIYLTIGRGLEKKLLEKIKNFQDDSTQQKGWKGLPRDQRLQDLSRNFWVALFSSFVNKIFSLCFIHLQVR